MQAFEMHILTMWEPPIQEIKQMQSTHKILGQACFILGLTSGLAVAGPPLICHSYAIGNDTSLPWSMDKNSWNNPDPKYDTSNLANDAMKLLDSGKPLLTRMETLRRASVYSAKDTAAGLDLGSRLMARALASEAKGESNSIALFDAGYFVESMKQMSLITKVSLFAGVDGRDWVKRSVPGLEDKLVAEYALGLMDSEWPNEHIRRAALGAQEGSLLAENLIKFFGNQSLAQVRRTMTAKAASR
jgi:hypothetical protein